MSNPKLITAPTEEAITLDALKDHLGVSGTEHDTRLEAMIRAARLAFESYCTRALISRTWDFDQDEFWDEDLRLPAPTTSITSITYYDTANALQTLSALYYVLDGDSEPSRVRLAYGYTWPSTYDKSNAVIIRYVSGYANAGSVPEDIKIGMLWWCESIYDNNPELEQRAQGMWSTYRWWPV